MSTTREELVTFFCPHCLALCEVPQSDIRCGIFRHAVFKDTMDPVPAHASRTECEQWVRRGVVYGCARPLRITNGTAVKCDYI